MEIQVKKGTAFYVYSKILPWKALSVLERHLMNEDGSCGILVVYETREAYEKNHADTDPMVVYRE